MGTTIEDVQYEEWFESEHENEIKEQVIEDYLKSLTPPTESYAIFDYLPINKRSANEQDYITYLWDSFLVLSSTENEAANKFSIFPFHMLFMVSLYYSTLKIAKNMPVEYSHALLLLQCRNKETLYNPTNPFNLGVIKERSIMNMFNLVDAPPALISIAKKLVDTRNDLAHVSGISESDFESKIRTYLTVLEGIQELFATINNDIAEKWISKIEPGESGVEYIDIHLAEEYLCPADMQNGKLSKLEDRLNDQV
jgi:hypothetical protein